MRSVGESENSYVGHRTDTITETSTVSPERVNRLANRLPPEPVDNKANEMWRFRPFAPGKQDCMRDECNLSTIYQRTQTFRYQVVPASDFNENLILTSVRFARHSVCMINE
ncbi:unnamed protein product [Cylicocyclus nassatus]|uniref:Uncharacterized protein n=1 Tax=Cylicocyclus nassatus TaxID=53992 RepID=A0AA36HDP1_CYLNA|nr:unnamed protein product [Cylicocyclus nassatus]